MDDPPFPLEDELEVGGMLVVGVAALVAAGAGAKGVCGGSRVLTDDMDTIFLLR
ncbi:hypothetical protein RGAI101_3384 [Roseobacter sp. GAI101]|nr:hypothetical protein RGAI101_3384 [Roseobacter sp. GAI101]